MIAGSWQRPWLRGIPSRRSQSTGHKRKDSTSRSFISSLPDYPENTARRQSYHQYLTPCGKHRPLLQNGLFRSPFDTQRRNIHHESQRHYRDNVQSGQSRASAEEVTIATSRKRSRRFASHMTAQQWTVSSINHTIPNGTPEPSIANQKRYKLSWSHRKAIEKRRSIAQNPLIAWKTFKRKSSPGESSFVQKPRPIHPRVTHLTSRGLSQWFNDTNHIYKLITSANSRKAAGTPKHLLSFRRYVKNGAVYQAWLSKSWRGKAIWWRHALYYAMLNSPADALRIIADISRRSHLAIPDWILADSLLLMDARYIVDDIWRDSVNQRISLFHETACTFLDQYTRRQGTAFLPWSIIRRLSRVLDEPSLTRFTASVASSKTAWSIYTKLHAMNRYLELDHLNKALDLFKTFTDEELNNRSAQAFCYTVLCRKWHVKNLHAFRRQLTGWFVKHGIQPDILVRHAILKNYLESGDKPSAFAMLDSIRAKGLATSEYTYAAFLNNTDPTDISTISSLHSMATEDGILRTSAFLSAYFIQIAASAGFLSGQNSFSTLLGLYERMFDTTDLVSFGILEQAETTTNMRSISSSFALEWMILSWIHENKGFPDKLVSAYNNYQFHVRNNHPRIAMLASKACVATAFVFAFGEHKLYLHMCTKVLQDMLQPEKPVPLPGSESLSREHSDESGLPDHEKFLEFEEPASNRARPLPFSTPAYADWDIYESLKREPFSYKVAPPSTATWNALLTVVLRHQQYDAAESVLKAMQQAGHSADQMTWNILLRSFADRHGSIRNILAEMRGQSIQERTDDHRPYFSSTTPAVPEAADVYATRGYGAPDHRESNPRTPSWQETDAEDVEEWIPDTVHSEMASRI